MAQNGQIVDLHRDVDGRLVLVDSAGFRHVGVEPVRGFPISDPDHWIVLCDSHGREVASIESLQALATPIRQLLEEELTRREFVPAIRRIVRMPADTEPTEWEVETDRGPTQFLINGGEDVRHLGPHRALVIDTQGIRYLIGDTRQLDALSRRVIEHYLPALRADH